MVGFVTEAMEKGIEPTRRPPKLPSLLDRCLTPKGEIPERVGMAVGLLAWSLAIAAWVVATYGHLVPPLFVPPPGAVLARAYGMAMDGSLWTNLWASTKVILIGFALSTLVAVPLGVAIGAFRIVQSAVEPLINFVRYLPVTAFMPLFILWIGIGAEQRVALIAFATFFSQVIMIAGTIRAVPQELLNASYTLGSSRAQVLWYVMLPAALPGILDTLRVTIGWAWSYVVAAELIAASSGLGYMSMKAARGFQVDIIFLAIAVIGLLGLVTDRLFRLLSARFAGWAH